MDTCYRCRYWQVAVSRGDGECVAAPMLKYGYAACSLGESWRYKSRLTPACRRYQAAEREAYRARELWVAEHGAAWGEGID